MRIGYPCINRSIGCQGNKTFKLSSYSDERLIETVENNLKCLGKMLRFNLEKNILFFRITSDLVPFASHPICKFNWQEYFRRNFQEIGELVKSYAMRISMHPDQFTLINSPDEEIFKRSIKELLYHAQVLDLLGLDKSAKIQIHTGGVYGNKKESIRRFVKRYCQLENFTKKRLVIENDDRNYTLKDCLEIHKETKIPVIFDSFHHQINNTGETIQEVFEMFIDTWGKSDGLPMVDYSSQQKQKRKGKHAESINLKHFKEFLKQTTPFDFDVMLEIKDKEKSAIKAVKAASGDKRLVKIRKEK